MGTVKGTFESVFYAMVSAKIKVRMIDQGADDLNVIIGVSDKDYVNAVKALIQTCVIDDVGEIDDAYYDNGKGSYLHLSLVSRAEFWFEVSFGGKGNKILMMGHFDPEDNTIRLEDGGLKAVLTFESPDELSVKVNGAFRRAFTVDADGTYTRHYGK